MRRLLFPHRRWIVGLGVVVIGVLVMWKWAAPSKASATTALASPRAAESIGPSPDQTVTDAATPVPNETDSKTVDIFGVRTWLPPPPPIAIVKPGPPPPPPLPQAPPLPFHLLGKIDDPERGMTFMLTRGDEILSVVIGDNIGNLYHVDKFNNGQLEFIYQPLHIRQTLFVGSDL